MAPSDQVDKLRNPGPAKPFGRFSKAPPSPADEQGIPPDPMPSAADTPLAESRPAVVVPAPQTPRVHEDSVLGVPLALTDYDETLDWIDATIAHDRRGYICVAAVHTVMVCQ